MKVYRMIQDIGFKQSETLEWTEVKQGVKAIGNCLPMLRSEVEIFTSMEELGVTKNIEPGRTFSIIER